MKEIEVKARLTNKAKVIQKLIEKGCVLTNPITQHDQIFFHDSIKTYKDIMPGTNVFRIRNQDGKAIFNLKKPQENELSCIEHETVVDSAKHVEAMLKYLQYRCLVEFSKTRQKTKLNNVEICIDEVSSLGSFIEVEKMAENETDTNIVQEELFQVLESLGVRREDRVHQGYDTMTYYKNNPAQNVEYLDIVDKEDRVVAQKTKDEKFEQELTSRNVAVFLQDAQGNLLITKRAANKRSFPNCYDLAACGHVISGENYVQAALRELKEELGVECEIMPLTKMYNEFEEKGKTLSYFTGIFLGTYNGDVSLNHELTEMKKMTIKEIEDAITENKEQFTPGFITDFNEVKHHLVFQ